MLSRLIYSSTRRCTDEELSQILEDARDFNARHDLSGALYLSGHTFVQYLEGDDLVVDALYKRIQEDPRHAQCRLLDQRVVMHRIFQGWSMTWLVRSPETDRLTEILMPHPTQASDMNGPLAASLFHALSKAAEHK